MFFLRSAYLSKGKGVSPATNLALAQLRFCYNLQLFEREELVRLHFCTHQSASCGFGDDRERALISNETMKICLPWQGSDVAIGFRRYRYEVMENCAENHIGLCWGNRSRDSSCTWCLSDWLSLCCIALHCCELRVPGVRYELIKSFSMLFTLPVISFALSPVRVLWNSSDHNEQREYIQTLPSHCGLAP